MTTDTQPVALVTGANRGLGRTTVLHLARAGVDSVLTYRANADEADAVVAEVQSLGRRAVALQLDTSKPATFDAFVAAVGDALREQWGRDTLDFLVNNAGSGVSAPFAETTEAQLDAMYAVHVKGPYLLTQRLLDVLADGGRVVNLSTGLTRFVGHGLSAYATAKGAVDVMTRYLAAELGPRGITVNAIAPGATGTDFAGGSLRDDPAVREAIAGAVAFGRVGEPDDIGGAITALLTGDTHWVTGQRIEASGGQQL